MAFRHCKSSLSPFVSLFLLAWGCVGRIVEHDFPGDNARARSAFVVNHGWHSAIVVKRADIPEALLPESRDFPDAQYLEIGWGDGDYYLAPDPGLRLALKAAFWSSGSVLHVLGFRGAVRDYFPASEVVEIRLPEEAFQRLARFLSTSFSRPDPAAPAGSRPGLYPNSRFYPATGRFHLFRTCNTWVAEALETAGLPLSSAFVVTAGNLSFRMRGLGRVREAR